MSTHAIVAISDGINIRAIYVHFDGYPSHTGKILMEGFNSIEKIHKLIDLGDLSSIESSNESCVAYGRDRGEKDVFSKSFASVSDLIAYGKSYYAAYIYLFEDNRWVVNKMGTSVWVPIEYAIKHD